MGKRYRILTDETFKNSKYINIINNVYGLKDFKKEYKKTIRYNFWYFQNIYTFK